MTDNLPPQPFDQERNHRGQDREEVDRDAADDAQDNQRDVSPSAVVVDKKHQQWLFVSSIVRR
jgi:hypothetical protein